MSTIQLIGLVVAIVVLVVLIVTLVVTRGKGGAEAADAPPSTDSLPKPTKVSGSIFDEKPRDELAELGKPSEAPAPVWDTAVPSAAGTLAAAGAAAGAVAAGDEAPAESRDLVATEAEPGAPPEAEPVEGAATTVAEAQQPEPQGPEPQEPEPALETSLAEEEPLSALEEPPAAEADVLSALEEAPASVVETVGAAEEPPAPVGEAIGVVPVAETIGAVEEAMGPAEEAPAQSEEAPSAAEEASSAAEEAPSAAASVALSEIIVTTNQQQIDLEDPEVRHLVKDLVEYEIELAQQYKEQGQNVDAVLQLTEAEKACNALGLTSKARLIRAMIKELKD